MCNVLWSSVKSHILVQVVNCSSLPESASPDGCSYYLLSATPLNNWQSLPKVTSKQHCYSTKCLVVLMQEITYSVIHCIRSILVLHRNFIPDTKGCLFKKLVDFRTSGYFAS